MKGKLYAGHLLIINPHPIGWIKYKSMTSGSLSIGQALSAVYCVSDAGERKNKRETEKLIRVLAGQKVFKTSNELTEYLASKGFVTIDVDGWAHQIIMECNGLCVDIRDISETDYEVRTYNANSL